MLNQITKSFLILSRIENIRVQVPKKRYSDFVKVIVKVLNVSLRKRANLQKCKFWLKKAKSWINSIDSEVNDKGNKNKK